MVSAPNELLYKKNEFSYTLAYGSTFVELVCFRYNREERREMTAPFSEEKIDELCKKTVQFFENEKKSPYPDMHDLNAPQMCYRNMLGRPVAKSLGFDDELNGYELQGMMYELRNFYACRDINTMKGKREMMELFKNACEKNIYVAVAYWSDSYYRERHSTFKEFVGFFKKYDDDYVRKFSYYYTLEDYYSESDSESFSQE